MEPWSEAIRNKSEGVKNWDSRSSGDISKVIESRLLTSIGHRALQVNENDSGFSSSAVIGKRYRSKTLSIFPLVFILGIGKRMSMIH
jgi:hypothetical protein